MIVLYTYTDGVIRYTDVDQIREHADYSHILRLKGGKYVAPKYGWTAHEIKLEKYKNA